jgi:hypothetical protein
VRSNNAIKFAPAFGLHRTPLSGRRLWLALRCIVIDAFEINLNMELVEHGVQFTFLSYFPGYPSSGIG